MLFSMTQGT